MTPVEIARVILRHQQGCDTADQCTCPSWIDNAAQELADTFTAELEQREEHT